MNITNCFLATAASEGRFVGPSLCQSRPNLVQTRPPDGAVGQSDTDTAVGGTRLQSMNDDAARLDV